MQKEIDQWAKEDVAIWAGSLGINNLAKLFFDAEIDGTNLQNINVAMLLDCGLNLRDAAFVVEQSRKLTEGNFEFESSFENEIMKCSVIFLDENSCSYYKQIPFFPCRQKLVESNIDEFGVTLIQNHPLIEQILTNGNEFINEYVEIVPSVDDFLAKQMEIKYSEILGPLIETLLREKGIVQKDWERVKKIENAKFPERLYNPFIRICVPNATTHSPYTRLHNDFNSTTRQNSLSHFRVFNVWFPLRKNLTVNTLAFCDPSSDCISRLEVNPPMNEQSGYLNSFLSYDDELFLFGFEFIDIGEIIVFETKRIFHCGINAMKGFRTTIEMRFFFQVPQR